MFSVFVTYWSYALLVAVVSLFVSYALNFLADFLDIITDYRFRDYIQSLPYLLAVLCVIFATLVATLATALRAMA